MKDLLKSILILSAVSTAAGLFLSEFDVSFWKSFTFTSIVQIVLWNGFTAYQRIKILKAQQEVEKAYAESLSKQEIQVPCAACNHVQVHLVDLNTDNKFQCEACDQKNALYINIESAAMTVVDDVKAR